MWPRWFPIWRRVALETSWSPAEAPRALGQALASPAALARWPWDGVVTSSGFRLESRGAQGRVLALGRWRACDDGCGSTVHVTLRPSFAAMVIYLSALPVTILLSLAVTLAAMIRGEAPIIIVWVLPLVVVLPHVVLRFAADMNEGEAHLRRLFPPPSPPNLGPFR